MSNTIRFKRGTKSQIDSLASKGGLLEGEPLYFTDLKTVGVASSKTTYEVLQKNHWACKFGPTSFISSHKVNYAAARQYGDSFDITSYAYGIRILITGQYEVRAVQRGNGSANPYIVISLDGDRTTLENRTSGLFVHDHTIDSNQYTESYYIGQLNAGEIICAGPVNSTESSYLVYGGQSILGSLLIKRL